MRSLTMLLVVVILTPAANLHAQDKFEDLPADYRKRLLQQIQAQQKILEQRKQEVLTHPTSPEAHFRLGDAYIHPLINKPDEAQEAYKSAIRLKSDYAEAHNGLGLALMKGSAIKEARDAFKKAISLKPNYTEAYFNLGASHLWIITGDSLEQEMKLAEEAFKQTLQIKPDYAEAHRGLGEAYYYQRRYIEAAEAYKQAIRFKPDDVMAQIALSRTYLRLGNHEGALEQYRIVSNLIGKIDEPGPKRWYLDNAKKLLEEIQSQSKKK